MRVTVFGGAGEIGGNQILLEGRESRILLDFGKSFARESEFFDEPYLRPRTIEQLRGLGLLPAIEGLYRGETCEPPVSGVLISHAHLDHMDYARYIREDIPLYVGECTWQIIAAREVTRPGPAEYKLAVFNEYGPEFDRCTIPVRTFGLQTFRTGKELEIGEFRVKPVHVDHSVPAAYGFVIDAPDGRVVYTGDIRFHGYKRELSEDFLRAAEKPDLLITEGTNVPGFRPSNEGEVLQKAKRIIQKANGLVVASFSVLDVDRMRTFLTAAKETGRRLVISMRQAALMELLRKEIESGTIDFPVRLGDRDILIYRREKKTAYKWEEMLAERFETVDSSWVSEHQSEILLFSTYYDMLELMAIKPGPGSVMIYSESEPWDEEGEIEFRKLENWLEHLGLPLFHIHASGHAGPFDLKDMIERLRPRKIIMVHSERPDLFRKFAGLENFVQVERGVPVEV